MNHSESDNNKRPNILWICTDQQRYDTIRALGNEHINTPNLDRLVAEGTALTHAYCQNPICTPSRASFLTGMYPSSVHACMNGNDHWSEAAPLVTKLLKDAGYDCGLVGKLHLSGSAGKMEQRPADDGYRVFLWSHSARDHWPDGSNAYVEWAKSQGAEFGGKDGVLVNSTPELHQTTWCANNAIEFMEENKGHPWLLSVNIFDPHKPFDPPQAFLDRYDKDTLPGPLFRESDFASQKALESIDFQTPCREPESFDARQIKAAYYAMVELVDENVGRMLDTLERTGQRENTLVIFMSDHGEMLGDHGLLLKGCRFYEGLVRVPLIFSWPGHISEDRRCDALVELMDVAPTLLEITGTGAPARMQGRSLWPLLTDPSLTGHRDCVRSEYYGTLQPGGLGLEKGRNNSYATMIRDRRYKLVVYHDLDKGELFDLENDPGEFENLWDDPACHDIRFHLMKKNCDALAFAVDVGPEATSAY